MEQGCGVLRRELERGPLRAGNMAVDDRQLRSSLRQKKHRAPVPLHDVAPDGLIRCRHRPSRKQPSRSQRSPLQAETAPPCAAHTGGERSPTAIAATSAARRGVKLAVCALTTAASEAVQRRPVTPAMGQGAGASRHRARANARSTPAAPSASAAPRRGAGGETCRRPILSHEARKISGQPAKRHHRRRLAGHFAPNFMHTLSGPRRTMAAPTAAAPGQHEATVSIGETARRRGCCQQRHSCRDLAVRKCMPSGVSHVRDAWGLKSLWSED